MAGRGAHEAGHAGTGGPWLKSCPNPKMEGEGQLGKSFDSPIRRRLLDTVEENPGVIVTELSKVSGLSHSTVSYHMKVLEAAGAVTPKRDGRIVRFYKGGDYDDISKRMLPLVKRARTREILKLIDARPTLCPFNIAQELRVSVPTVMWHLHKLEDYGAVTLEKKSGQYDILLNPEMRPIIKKAEEDGMA